MPPNIVRNYQEEIIETITDLNLANKWFSSTINLGGVSGPGGGSGGPVGGYFGLLPQTKVAYDTTEAAYQGIQTNVPSGSLVDNLAHMRYRLGVLEASGVGGAGGGSGVLVEDEGSLLGTAQTLDFVGAGVTASILGTEVTVTIPGATDTDEKTKVSSNDTTADYLENKLQAGSNITLAVLNEGGNEKIEIASTASGSGADEKVKVSANDTTEDYLENKIVAGNNTEITVLNEGANEQLQITSTGSGGASGSGIFLRDEGVDLGNVTTLDFVGGSVEASVSGSVGTVTISGTGGGSDFILVSEVIVTSGVGSVDVEIPQWAHDNYSVLEVSLNTRSTRTGDVVDGFNMRMGPLGGSVDTGASDYSWQIRQVLSDGFLNSNFDAADDKIALVSTTTADCDANHFAAHNFTIHGFNDSNMETMLVGEFYQRGDASSPNANRLGRFGGMWHTTEGLGTLRFYPANSNWEVGSTFRVYAKR